MFFPFNVYTLNYFQLKNLFSVRYGIYILFSVEKKVGSDPDQDFYAQDKLVPHDSALFHLDDWWITFSGLWIILPLRRDTV